MSVLQQPLRSVEVPPNGGAPARRAVARWAWRLFRREWRGQVLVLVLLTLAVAAAVGGSAAAYNLAPAEGGAAFGSASHSVVFDQPEPRGMPLDTAAAVDWFGTTDVINRRFVPVPGLFDQVEFRDQDPGGAFSAPMLSLVAGDYPRAAGELAVTDGVADIFAVGVGDSFPIDDQTWTVVGTVENPSALNDEFALVASGQGGPPERATILVDASDDEVSSFRAPSGAATATAGRPGLGGLAAAGGVLAAAVVLLLLVALVAAAGFVVVAHRRLRQLGMLAAIGATVKHLRLVMLANGAVIGVLAAIVGSVVGLVSWFVIAPRLETAVGHRITAFNVPWWLIGTGMLLAVVTATAAAWWPAQAVSRTPIVAALSGRPSRPQPAQRSVVVAGLLVVFGVGCLVLGEDPVANWINVLLIVAGTSALTVGILFLCPVAVRTLAAMFSSRAPVSVRVALRDLVRFQAKSAAALAAITLTLGIAAALVISTSAALYTSEAEGNLSTGQLLIRVGEIPPEGDVAIVPERTQTELDNLDAAVDRIAGSLGGATVLALDVALAPEEDGFEGLPAVVLTEAVEVDDGTAHRILTLLYVAQAEMLEHYGLDPAAISPEIDVLTVETGELWYQPMRPEVVRNVQTLTPSYSSLPASFITTAELDRRGWESGRAAWLVETSAPITDEQFAAARDLAAAAGVTIEARDKQADVAATRNVATALGILMALGFMAITVGLIRGEAAGDLRILTASGATSSNRRTLTGATAGGLALLGAVLGTGGAYLGLGAAHVSDLSVLSPVPVWHLLVLIVGMPLVAAVAGWLLAGREPSSLVQPIV